MEKPEITRLLNAPIAAERIAGLRRVKAELDAGHIPAPEKTAFVNNHIHTTFSFSPYSPTLAVWLSFENGLQSSGLMDHDSIAGAREFLEAGKILNFPVTIGVECRTDFSNTRLNGRLINHPDQDSTAYSAIHGIPHGRFDDVSAFFAPCIRIRNERNARMTAKLNEYLKEFGLSLDFEKDVLPLSQSKNGGAVTERHLLYALALRLIAQFGCGAELVALIEKRFAIPLSDKLRKQLLDDKNPFYAYDLLGALKGAFTPRFYIPAHEECLPVRTVAAFSHDIGAIFAYAYLGDVTDSVTGDKIAQRFEDSYLDLLFDELPQLGFQAVTYMPARNTVAQLQRVQKLCNQHNLLQISGEDINSPRQLFRCEALKKPEYRHLVDATWALIGHELSATANPANGFFTPETERRFPALADRINHFAAIARAERKP